MQTNAEIIGSYPKLFDERSDETQSGKDKPQSFHAHWGWFAIVDALSNNDITKWEYIVNLPLIEFLNILSYYKDKQKHLADQMALRNM